MQASSKSQIICAFSKGRRQSVNNMIKPRHTIMGELGHQNCMIRLSIRKTSLRIKQQQTRIVDQDNGETSLGSVSRDKQRDPSATYHSHVAVSDRFNFEDTPLRCQRIELPKQSFQQLKHLLWLTSR